MLSQNYPSPVFKFRLNLSDEKLLWYNTRKKCKKFSNTLAENNYVSNALENQQFDSMAFQRLQGVAQTLYENKQCYEEKLNVRYSTKTRNLGVLTSISYKKRTDWLSIFTFKWQ